MRKWISFLLLIWAATWWFSGPILHAVEPSAPARETVVREVFVPFESLNLILEDQPQRVLLTRQEYQQLKKAARAEAQARPPRDADILSADYQILVQPDRASIVGSLVLDVLSPGIQAVGLDIGNVGLRQATLDETSAPIGRADDGRLELFVSGVGRHTLRLEMVAPLETTAATQILNYRLPTPPATRLRLTVPGDVEVKSGMETVSRHVDQAAGVTSFELLPRRGDVSIAMTLNSRLLRQERVVVARGVVVDEVTQAYERLHATMSMAVLHKAVDEFTFAVPEGFEITHVQSPRMARWSVDKQAAGRILRVALRDLTTETVVLSLSAIKTAPPLDKWSFPRLEPLDVEGQVAVVGLLVEDRLQPQSIESQGLIPIDTSVLTQALPASIFQAEPGSPRVRPVVAGYAPQSRFSLTARFSKPDPEVFVTTNLLLTLADKEQEVRGGFSLLPKSEKCFAFDFAAPADWNVTAVTDAENKPLAIERFDQSGGGTRIHVRLPQGVAPRQEYRLYFQASHQPAKWLESWTTIQTSFPPFTAISVTRETGALAVAVRDDLTTRATAIEHVELLDEHEKAKYGLGGVPTLLAFRFDRPNYRVSLEVERVKPRLTARTFSSFVIKPEALVAHYELLFNVEDAAARELTLILPDSTPESLMIRGLGGVRLKEYVSKSADGLRRWSASLSEPGRGKVALAVDFQQPLPSEAPKDLPLPIIRAEGMVYQSGLVSVEGSAELNIEIKTDLRKADIGELVDAEYQPGKRLLGVYRFVGDQPAVTVSVSRDQGYLLPALIVQRAELTTVLDPAGLAQTAARFVLRTKAQFAQVDLPSGSTLWSMVVDGRPAAPQREGTSLLISLPTTTTNAPRDLRVVYETPVESISLSDSIDLPAPKLRLREKADAQMVDVPVADLAWYLYAPTGFKVLTTGGTVFTEQVQPPPLALTDVAERLLRACGGINWFYDGYGLARARGPSRPRVPTAAQSKMARDLLLGGDGDDVLRGGESETSMEFSFGDVDAPKEAAVTHQMIIGAPSAKPAPPPPPPAKPGMVGRRLEGVRSLAIDLQETGKVITFKSLGGEPRLEIGMANVSRLQSLAWTLAGIVGLIGLIRVNRPVRWRIAFVVVIIALTTALPLITGSAVLTELLNPACYAAFLLVPAYILIAVVRWLLKRVCPAVPARSAAVIAGVILACVLCSLSTARAQDRENPAISALIERLSPPAPVKVPADAIIVPYDPKSDTGIRDAAQLLLPYDQFVALWNQAHPDQMIETAKPPAAYALAGAAYSTTLQGDENLLIEGKIEIESYTDEPIAIPLALEGGVLARADMDHKPARLSVAQAAPPAMPSGEKSQAIRRIAPRPSGSLLLLHLTQRGRHQLEITVRMKLDRPGGWRVAQGRLPVAPATSLSITVPDPQTEVRFGHIADRRSILTTAPREVIATALSADGAVDIRWRPKVGEGTVDRSLTADSTARFDVQEDGLRLDWTARLTFRRGERDFFNFGLPEGYLVVQVAGGNVRGWESRETGARRELTVSLLKPAKDAEGITIRLWRRGEVGGKSLSTFEVPIVTVTGAALHQGNLEIRRSPLLNLQTTETQGAARTDLRDKATSQPADVGPLGVRPYQAYRFASTPFTVRLEAEPVRARVTGRLQTILRIAERERNLETRVILNVEHRPLYRVQMVLPPDLKVDRVTAPGVFEWAITKDDRGAVLSVYLTHGQQGDAQILVTGQLGETGPVEQVALPRLTVLDLADQEGDIVVQADPAYRVEPRDLVNCETMLLTRTHTWLAENQRSLAKLALHYRGTEYGGLLRLSLQQPIVFCYTVTNVRVTSRAVEETVLLDFSIQNAGIREVAFLLPAHLKDARISTPQLRQKTVTPTADQPDAPVRVRLELQDKVMGQLRVLVQNDRQLTADTHHAPIPVVETGTTTRRYVLLESAGRSEVVVESSPGLDALTREQQEWKWLASILGGGVTQAYILQPEAANPDLAFRTRDRAIVETAGASIGLAETLMVVDESGTYRAVQVLRVHNTTEQYLEVVMPPDAMLWTTRVAGEAVKPTQVPGPGKPRNVRIPLVKTAAGDLDYEVVLKYGGRLSSLRAWPSVSFPMISTVNIEVALSQVRLYLPETYKWFDFGGTARQAADEAQLAADYIIYQNRKAEQLAQALSSSDDYARVRAAENLGLLGQQVEQFRAYNPDVANTVSVQAELRSNALIISNAGQQIQQITEELGRAPAGDNRAGLDQYFQGQRNDRSLNVVNTLSANFFDAGAVPQPRAASRPADVSYFRSEWFDYNGLVTTAPQNAPTVDTAQGLDVNGDGLADEFTIANGTGNVVFHRDRFQTPAQLAQPQAPNVAQVTVVDRLQSDYSQLQSPFGKRILQKGEGEGDESAVTRYRSALQGRAAKQRGLRAQIPSLGWEVDGGFGRTEGGTQTETRTEGRSERGGGYGGFAITGIATGLENAPTTRPASSAEAEGAAVLAPAGLASLDVEIPIRGQAYFFTTPRGKVEITTRAVSGRFIVNAGYIVLVLLVVLVGVLAYRCLRDGQIIQRHAVASATTAIVVGAIMLLTGCLPVAGALLLLAGLLIRVRQWRQRSAQPATHVTA